jgi:predicted 3-demethylubiquinone-9 3-methyltransferase (glyoxalase superfamily)
MQKITPHLWFDREAKEAAEFYTSLFPDSKITNITTLHDTPSGSVDVVSFALSGQPFMAISAGPLFRFNPSVSFIVNFGPSRDKNAWENLDKLWEKLSQGGAALMPLDKYPFSERYGWLQDKYGLSWQLILSNPEGEERPFIVPSLMFVGKVCGKAEESTNFYMSVFKNSRRGTVARYPKGMEPDNEATSFMVYCDTQKEIDYYWDRLSAVPEAEQCGWLKDKYGLSRQIVPTTMDEMMANGTREQIDRLTQAFLPMKKLVIAELEKAFKGK